MEFWRNKMLMLSILVLSFCVISSASPFRRDSFVNIQTPKQLKDTNVVSMYQESLSGHDRSPNLKKSNSFIQRQARIVGRLMGVMEKLNNILGGFSCDICKVLTTLIQVLFTEGKTHEEIIDQASKICITLRIEDVHVCEAITREFQVEVFAVLEQLALSPEEICGLVFGDACATTYNPLGNWSITLPDVPKPPITPHKLPKPGSPTLRILHISDIHFDHLYKEGSNAACDEPLCCRDNDGPTEIPGSRAGKWGDYRHCDIPLVTLENLFIRLNNTQDQFDIVYWTGDLPAHDVWNQTRQDQTNILRILTELFLKYLPNKAIYSALGNHESSPVNSFPPPFISGKNSIEWLYDAVSDSWMHWLPPQTAPTVKYGAYYTVVPYPGFRIISVNTNYCNAFNWWLLLNTTDPAGELDWLSNVLQTAENNGEKVHIIGHIPPGRSDCLKAWSWNYYKIINRYESTIAAQFFGHTHFDHFQMFYDETDMKRPVGVSYIVGSVTTFPGLNPGYRIYQVDGKYHNSSWAVLDHTNYILNISDANLHPSLPAQWQLFYTAKNTYNMSSLFPADWNNLIQNLQSDSNTFKTFYSNYKKGYVIDGDCDDKCEENIICGLKNGRSHDSSLCNPEE